MKCGPDLDASTEEEGGRLVDIGVEPLKVCLVSPMPPPLGGIARWTSMIMARARTCADLELSLIDTALRWRAVHDTALVRRVLAGVPQLLGSTWKLLRLALIVRPDVVHVNTSGQLGVIRDMLLVAVCRVLRIPFVYHIRFGRIPYIAVQNTLEWKAIMMVMRRSKAVIVLDALTAKTVERELSEIPLSQVPNCVDVLQLPQVASREKSTRVLLFLGWVLPGKGIEELVEAWRKIDRRGWRLRIAGPCADSFRTAILDGFDSDLSVEFLGEVAHSAGLELIASCDLFVLPSHTEGFPNVVLEAMALGIPIIATGVGAVSEMLANDRGLVVPPRATEELAVALGELMQDERRRNELGERAKAWAWSHYSLESVFERYLDLWHRVAEGDKMRKDALMP
jgi:glycosyltransferase involved in cell wall biosynthesis